MRFENFLKHVSNWHAHIKLLLFTHFFDFFLAEKEPAL